MDTRQARTLRQDPGRGRDPGLKSQARPPGIGELDRVAHEVAEHLPHPHGVAEMVRRHGPDRPGGERHALGARLRLEEGGNLTRHGHGVERLGDEFDPPRLQAGHVEHVVHDGQ